MLLEPAVTAFGAVGVPARLDEDLEVCVGDRKICGHGAGQIEQAVVLCGNLIERFDYERAARVLAMADPAQRDQTLVLMRRFVAATRSIRLPSGPPWSVRTPRRSGLPRLPAS